MEFLNHTLFLRINADAQPPALMLQLSTFLAQWLIDGIPLAGLAMAARWAH